VASRLVSGPAGDAAHAAAQPYPSRPVRVVVPFAAGSTTDTVTRAVGVKLAEALDATVTIRMDPLELANSEERPRPWWEGAAQAHAPQGYTINFIQQINIHGFGVSAGEPASGVIEGEYIVIDAEDGGRVSSTEVSTVS
jgi:hypothetical protein